MKSMKVIIFGASGGLGQQLIMQCLEKNYTVSVFVRNPDKVKEHAGKINIFIGDVLDFNAVEKAIKGQDAVLVTLGIRPGDKSKILSKGTDYIVRAMEKYKVRRLVCVTGAGLTENRQQLPVMWRLVMKLPFLNDMFEDKRLQESIVKNSKVDWILVRPANLTNGLLTKDYIIGENTKLTLGATISRADTADFMVKQLTSRNWLHKGPLLIAKQ